MPQISALGPPGRGPPPHGPPDSSPPPGAPPQLAADMTGDQFAALARLLWGDDWRRRAASLLGVNLRNVQFWTATAPARVKPIPHGVAAELLGEVRRRRAGGGAEAARLAEEGRRGVARARLIAGLTARGFPESPGH